MPRTLNTPRRSFQTAIIHKQQDDNEEEEEQNNDMPTKANFKFIKEFNEADKLNDKNWIDWVDHIEGMFKMCKVYERFSKDAIVSKIDQEKEDIALYLLKNNVTAPQRQLIRKCSTAKEAFDTLQKKHVKGHVTNRVRLIDELLSGAKMKSDEDPTKYIQSMKMKIEQLEAIGVALGTDFQSYLLLRALPERYNMIAVALDAAEVTPPLSKIQSMAENEYSRTHNSSNKPKREKSEDDHDNEILLTDAHPKRRKIRCGICDTWGYHKDENCWNKPGNEHLKKEFHTRKKSHTTQDTTTNEAHIVSSLGPTWCLMTGQNHSQNLGWVLDTGATNDHMSGNLGLFDKSTLRRVPERIVGTAGNDLVGVLKGTVVLRLAHGSVKFDCLYVPGLKANLLSVGKILDNDMYQPKLSRHELSIWHGSNLILKGIRDKDLWWLEEIQIEDVHHAKTACTPSITKDQTTKKAQTSQNAGADMATWHRRLGHCNVNDISKLRKAGAKGLVITDPQTDFGIYMCEACIVAKHHTEGRSHQSLTRATLLLELIHSDLSGPINVKDRNGARYILTFIDDFSRLAVIFLIKDKEAATIRYYFEQFIVYAERETGNKLKCVRVDGGSEYKATMSDILRQKGIRRHTTNPDKPHENGIAERYNRTIWEGTRAILANQRVAKHLWGDAALYMCHIKNCLPHSALDGKTPFELYHKRTPDLSNIRVFGCQTYIKVVAYKSKLDARSKLGTFIGFAEGTRGWKIMTQNGRITTSKDCIFVESPEYLPKNNIEEHMIDIPWKNISIEQPSIAVEEESSSFASLQDQCEQPYLEVCDDSLTEGRDSSAKPEQREQVIHDGNPQGIGIRVQQNNRI